MSHDINIKDCRKAVNQAKYNPTAERKAQALKLLTELMDAVSNLEEVTPKATKPKAKAKPKAKHVTPKRKARKSSNQRLEESQAKDNVSTTYIPKDIAEVNHLPEFAQLREMGYGVEDAARYVNALMQGAPQVA